LSGDLGPVGEVDGPAWRTVLGLDDGADFVAVVVEGSWWRAQRTSWRMGKLEAPRESGIPDVWLGDHEGRTVMYACLYGAPRAAEVVHVAALAGARLAIQIGTCGIVGGDVAPGDVIVPQAARCLDSVAATYGAGAMAPASDAWVGRAVEALEARGCATHRGTAVTWPTLFAQPVEEVRVWQQDGHLGVDMETATTLAVASRFGVPAVSMLVAWDKVLSGRSFLDPLSPLEAAAFDRANEAVFDVALELADQV